jgi:hypothetical protein
LELTRKNTFYYPVYSSSLFKTREKFIQLEIYDASETGLIPNWSNVINWIGLSLFQLLTTPWSLLEKITPVLKVFAWGTNLRSFPRGKALKIPFNINLTITRKKFYTDQFHSWLIKKREIFMLSLFLWAFVFFFEGLVIKNNNQ